MKSDKILASYDASIDAYSAYTKNLAKLLAALLKQEGIEFFRIEKRTKKKDSLAEKIQREDKDGKYESLEDVTDISGIRIITYLKEDCDQISEFLSKEFDIDAVNSVHKSEDLESDRFGYQSIHLILSYKKERTKLTDFRRFGGLKAEVQIKTLLQHTWAAIDWKLRYKSSVEVPKRLRRRLYRISALLEAADDDFSYVSTTTKEIKEQYKISADEGNYNIALDAESIATFFANEEWYRENVSPVTSLAIEQEFDVRDDDMERFYNKFFKTTSLLGINTVFDLMKVLEGIRKSDTSILREIYSEWAKGRGGPWSSSLGVIRIAITASRPDLAQRVISEASFNSDMNDILIEKLGIGGVVSPPNDAPPATQ